jgi:hypothetical protein
MRKNHQKFEKRKLKKIEIKLKSCKSKLKYFFHNLILDEVYLILKVIAKVIKPRMMSDFMEKFITLCYLKAVIFYLKDKFYLLSETDLNVK